MGESNGSWGALAEADPELARSWDAYQALPEPGVNEPLDSFCERKRITIPSLVRVGARLSEDWVLAFAFPDGIKYRDLITDRRWSSVEAQWSALKIIPATAASDGPRTAIVAEGESDAARLTLLFPGFDVAVMPSGAGHWPRSFADQLERYQRVLVGLDSDAAGERGAQKILASLATAVRFAPPANDWCDTETPPPLPDAPQPTADVVFGRDLMSLEAPEHASWFEHDLLPIGGQLILHGWAKSFKSFMAFDLLSAIATGQPWCCFEPVEEPARVCVIQWEVPWPYYKARCHLMREASPEPGLWDENYGSWRPLMRPALAAGNVKHEDAILGPLVKAGVQALLVDPVRRAMGANDMNSEQDVRKLLGFFERLQNEGITVVATHHDSKAGARSRGGDMLAMTGAGAFAGDCDTAVSVSLPRGCALESPFRDLHFSLRNSAPVAPRSFTMRDTGHVSYGTTAHETLDDSEPVPDI